jgi:hypothetical protein
MNWFEKHKELGWTCAITMLVMLLILLIGIILLQQASTDLILYCQNGCNLTDITPVSN